MCTPYNSDKFEKQILYSCEFDRGFDTEYWENPKDDKFATWTFFPENVETRDGKLELKIKYYKHKRGTKDLYFTSGMLRSKSKVGYGYYEARIKEQMFGLVHVLLFGFILFPVKSITLMERRMMLSTMRLT